MWVMETKGQNVLRNRIELSGISLDLSNRGDQNISLGLVTWRSQMTLVRELGWNDGVVA